VLPAKGQPGEGEAVSLNMLSHLQELYQYRELVRRLVIRDLKVRYKNSILGFFWSLVNPLAQVFVITIIFKYVIRIGFPNYSAYVLAGFLPWTFFQMAVLDASDSILLHRGLLKKVYIPREVIPISIVISNLIHFGLALLVLFVYMLFIGIPFTYKLVFVIPLIFFHLLFTLGVGLIVSAYNVFYEDIKYMMTVGLSLLFYLVPVIYVVEQLADGIPPRLAWLYHVYHLNPLAVWISAFRKVFLPPVPEAFNPRPLEPAHLLVAAALSIAIAIIGYAVFNKRKWQFAENL
jgi:ABC-type polysaccharide/polyol phosphate export permease